MKRSGFNKKPGFEKKTGFRGSIGLDRNKYRKKALKTKARKKAAPTPRQLEIRKLDRIFSLLVRALWAGAGGVCACFTCGTKAFWKQSTIQCGHFKSRSNMATRWMVLNAHPQCAHCNQVLGGNLTVYRTKLIEEYGDHVIDDLEREADSVVRRTLEELKTLRLGLEKQLKNIRFKKGL